MRHWSAKPHFGKLRAKLAITSGHDFQRAILPLLHVMEQKTLEAPPLSSADCCGIDHLVWSEVPPLPLVVQAKGFKVNAHELGKSQIDQCLASIDTFRRSGLRTSKYLLVHNRDGRSGPFRQTIEAALAQLVKGGHADTAFLWDCNQLLRAAFEAMLDRVRRLLETHRLTQLDARESSESAEVTLDYVPFREANLQIDQWGLAADKTIGTSLGDPAQSVLKSKGASSGLILGEFGLGKTTTALRSLDFFPPDSRPLFLAAPALEKRAGGSRDFLRQCVNVSEVLKDFPFEDWETIKLLFPSAVERLLFDAESSVILIIDGLDEAPMFHHRQGMQDIFNFLYSAQIPVILTMRTEFWHARQTDFTTFMGARARGNRRPKEWTLIELLQWETPQILELAQRRLREEHDDRRRANLGSFVTLLETDGYQSVYGDIPRRPLFLRMILDSVTEQGIHQTSKSALVAEWARLKIIRDLRAPALLGGGRPLIVQEAEGIDITIELAFVAMEIAAAQMTQELEGKIELIAKCSVEKIVRKDRRLERIVDPTGLFLCSLLLPVSRTLPGEPIQVRFAHRAFQEYFLARYSMRMPDQFAHDALPDSVRNWMVDLQRETTR